MKTVLIVLGTIFLVLAVLVGGFVALLFWAHSSGSDKQEAFFEAVGSGDAANVRELFHPDLAKEIDEPVLAAWMKAFNENLGKCEGLSKASFSTEADGNMLSTSGTVNFEKGKAASELVFVDDKIVKFKVESEQLPDDWFQGPAETGLYRQRGQKVLELLLGGKPAEAHAMFHEKAQEISPLTAFEALAESMSPAIGDVTSIEAKSDEYEVKGSRQLLHVLYTVTGENDATEAMVTFEFDGMKGHPVALELAPPPSAAGPQVKFFKAVATGDPAKVMALFHPKLKDQIDAPVLAVWIKAFNKSMGDYEGLTEEGLTTETKEADAGTLVRTLGVVTFEKGPAMIMFVTLGEAIVEWQVQSDLLPDDWFQGPGDTNPYRKQGTDMFYALLKGDAAKAHGMFHESYREEFPLAKLQEQMASVLPQWGKVKMIKVEDDQYAQTDTGQFLRIDYTITCENAVLDAAVLYQFVGLKGHMVEFKAAPESESEAASE